MSAIDTDSLKSVLDPTVPSFTHLEAIGTAIIKHDSLLEWNKLIKSVKIVNNDDTNPIGYRNQSPFNVLRQTPINSDETINEWTSFFEVVPNAITGNGVLEFELVDPGVARK